MTRVLAAEEFPREGQWGWREEKQSTTGTKVRVGATGLKHEACSRVRKTGLGNPVGRISRWAAMRG